MEVITMAHELNIGTIGGYSADELVNRIVEVIPITAVQKEYAEVTAVANGQQSIGTSTSFGTSKSTAVALSVLDTTKILAYEYVSVVLTVIMSVSGTISGSNYNANCYSSFGFRDDNSNALKINSTNLTSSNVSISFSGTVSFYMSYRYPGGFAYKKNLSDEWIYCEPNAYLTITSDTGISGNLNVTCKYTYTSAYGVLR